MKKKTRMKIWKQKLLCLLHVQYTFYNIIKIWQCVFFTTFFSYRKFASFFFFFLPHYSKILFLFFFIFHFWFFFSYLLSHLLSSTFLFSLTKMNRSHLFFVKVFKKKNFFFLTKYLFMFFFRKKKLFFK